MADAGLEYALRIRLKEAEQDIEKFISSANKKLDKIKTPDLTGMKGGSNHGYAVGSKVGKDAEKQAKSWQEISKAMDEASESAKQLTAEEKRLAKAFRELEPATKKYATSNNDVIKSVQKLSREEQKAADKRMDLFETIKKQSSERRRTAEDMDRQEWTAERKRSERVVAERKKLEQLKTSIMAQAERFRIQKGITSKDQQAKLEAELTAITKQAGDRRIEVLREEMRTRLTVFRQGAKEATKSAAAEAAERANAENAKAKNFGRASLVGFQVQQAIEDFQFAGIRGAANNIALIAARLGGPAGLIALAGLAGYQLKSMYDTWRNGDKDLEKAIRQTDNYINRLQKLRDLEMSRTESGRELKPVETGAERIEARGALAFAEQDEQHSRETVSHLKQQEEALTRLYSLRKRVADIDKKTGVGGLLLGLVTNPVGTIAEGDEHLYEERKKHIEEAIRLEDELRQQGVVVPSLEGANWEEQKKLLMEAREEHQKLIDDGQKDLDAKAEATRHLEKQVMLSDTLHAEMSRRVELQERLKNADLTADEQRQVDNAEARLSVAQKELGARLEKANTLREESAILEQHRALLDAISSQEERIVTIAEQRAEAIENATTAMERANSIASQAASLAERGARAEEQKAQAARKTAMALMDQARASRDAFKGDVFEARRSITSQKNQEQMEKALKASEAGLRSRFARQFGKGTPEQNQGLEKLIQDRAEKIRKRAEAAGKKADEKLVKARESDLIKSGLSKLQAGEQAGKAGNLELATKLFGEGRAHLEELKRLQLGKVGTSGSAAGEKALKDAATTQAAIEKSLLVESKINQGQAAKSEQKAGALQQLADQMSQIKANADQLEIIKDSDIQKAQNLIKHLDIITKKIQGLSGLPQSGLAGGEKGVKGKAAGGLVSKGNPYVVGEAGMELFIPAQNGRIATALETRQMLQGIGFPAAMAALSQQRNQSPVSQSAVNNRFGEINVNLHGSTVSDMKNALMREAKAQSLRTG